MGRSRDSKRRDRSSSHSRHQYSSSSDSDSYGRRSRSRSRDRRRSRSHGRRAERNSSRRHSRGRSRSRGERRRRSPERSRSRSNEKDSSGKHDRRSTRRHSKTRSRGNEEKTKDVVKGIEAMKLRMRSALESVQAEMADAVEGKSMSNETRAIFDLTVTETVARHRDIERIEDEGFSQTAFVSSAGGAGGRVKKENVTDRAAVMAKKQDAHDKAIFGPKWRDTEQKYGDEKKETTPDTEVHMEVPLANPRLFEDPAVREERWLKIYHERRAKLLCL